MDAPARTSTYPPESPRSDERAGEASHEASASTRHADPTHGSIPFQLVRRSDVLRVPRAGDTHEDGDDEHAKLLLDLQESSRKADADAAASLAAHAGAYAFAGFPFTYPFAYPMPFYPMLYPSMPRAMPGMPYMQPAMPGVQSPPVPVPAGTKPVPHGDIVHPSTLRRIHQQPQDNGKRARISFSPQEIRVMEAVYAVEPVPSLETRLELAQKLSIPPRRIQVWFQNKRARSKRPGSAPSSMRNSTADAESVSDIVSRSRNSTDEAHSQ